MKHSVFGVTLWILKCIQSSEGLNVFAPLKLPTSSNASPPPPPSKIDTESWLDVLKYDTPPSFDVLAKSIEFANCNNHGTSGEEYYADDYVFRGSIVGPISYEEAKSAQEGFNIQKAYPNLETRPFGFTIDPDNEYRCYWFERWEGTNMEGVKVGPLDLPPTGNDVKLPTHVISANWTPEGKIKYLCLSSPLDRFEGTTQGVGAVFGLLVGAGIQISSASPGDAFLRFQQRLAHVIGGLGRGWSEEGNIPSWWKSKARGADPNDM